jgi:hypothetical protein
MNLNKIIKHSLKIILYNLYFFQSQNAKQGGEQLETLIEKLKRDCRWDAGPNQSTTLRI